MDILLGLDLGTTGCKAALYTPDGQLLGSHYAEYGLITPRADWVEQDANIWWDLARKAVQEAVVGGGVDGKTMRALSISSQGISFVPVDTDGTPLRNALTWLDTRAKPQAEWIASKTDDALLFQWTGKRAAAFYVLPKLLWLREHEPELYAQTHKFLMAHDFLLAKFCGARATDYSMAGGSLMLDLERLDWSAPLLGTFGIEREKLPDLQWAGTQAGTILPQVAAELGLSDETVVVVGGQDQKCAALGAGIQPGRVTVSLGTASAITCLLGEPLLDSQRRIPTYPFVVPGYWELEGVVSTAGAAVKWLRNTLFPHRSYQALDELARQSPPGANGVRFFPHLAGASSPIWQASASGTFEGLNLGTGACDIVRSVLEGIAFQIAANLRVVETMQPVREVVAFGGGAQSALWCEILANVTNKPVYVTETVDVANWGACLLAGRGIGIFDNALEKLNPQTPRLIGTPDASVQQQYHDIYAVYQQSEQRLLE
jgi:xylulokinase